MNRRMFLRQASLASAGWALAKAPASARAEDDTWRRFEITTRVEVMRPVGPTRAWLPVPLAVTMPFQQPATNTFAAEDGAVRVIEDRPSAFAVLAAEWPDGVRPVLTLTSRVATRDYAVDLSKPPRPVVTDRAALAPYLRATKLLPIDGVVHDTATKITRGVDGDLAKARAIYEWIVDHTFRDPAARGCGLGDIRFMLESNNLGGKCADLNALYVGLARAAGLPARDVYGVRVAPSARGYRSLGAASGTITRAQHCRAEVYVAGYGWVPVDPADVRKVVLE